MFKLSALTQRERTIAVELPNEMGPLTVTYRPWGAENERRWAEIAADPERGTTEKRAAELAQILTGWDVTEDGKPTVPTYDLLAQLDVAILRALFTACAEDMSPPRGASVTSAAG